METQKADGPDLGNTLAHLRSQFLQASPILFTGAGFTIQCKNREGNALPSGKALAKELWNIVYPGQEFEEGSELQDIFQRAVEQHRKTTTEFLRTRLTVDSGPLPPWYTTLLSCPWKRIYTLNIDDLAAALQRVHRLPRRLIPISALTDKAMAHRGTNPAETLEFIHLNGTLDDIPERITFSLSQYAQRLAGDDPWYAMVARDLVTSSVVFMGTELDEPSLWLYIEKRRMRQSSDARELRPKSYIVTPRISIARRDVLRSFNIVWLPMTAEQFTQEVIGKISGSIKEGHTYLLETQKRQCNRAALLLVGELLSMKHTGTSDLFLGAEPSWDDMLKGKAITRSFDSHLLEVCRKALGTAGLIPPHLLTGTAGTGKSASLKRLALALHGGGLQTIWVDSSSQIGPREILKSAERLKAQVVLIDDADVYGAEISSLVLELALLSQRPLVVFGMRSSRVDVCITPALTQKVELRELVVPSLSDTDIDLLLTALQRHDRLGVMTGLPYVSQAGILRRECGRQLLVAMISATSGEQFERRVDNELNQLEGVSRIVYAHLCVATALRQRVNKGQLLIAAQQVDNEAMNAIDQLQRRGLIIVDDNGDYSARHRVVGERVLEYLQGNGMLADVLYGLCFAFAADVRQEMPPTHGVRRYLLTMMNHDFLLRTIGEEAGRRLYERLEEVLRWDFGYWLHRGSLELECDKLQMAEVFLNTARGKNPDDLNTQTEYAYLLMKKALASPTDPLARNWVEDAARLLLANIARRGTKDPHSYHVYGNNLLKWARAATMSFDERKECVEDVRKVLTDALQRHPANPRLNQLKSECDAYYLSLAVASP